MRTSLIINPYGVLITVVETEIRRMYARATHSARWSEDIELPADLSDARLMELSNADVWKLCQGKR